MDFIRKNKFTFWTIVLLVVLNLLTLGTLWLQRGKGGRFPMRPQEGGGPDRSGNVDRFLEKELDLSDEQAQKFSELRRLHFQEMGEKTETVRKLRKEILEEVFKPSPDTAKITRLTADLGVEMAKIERFLIEHLIALKEVCLPEQREKLGRLLRETQARERPPGRPPDGQPWSRGRPPAHGR